MERRLEEGHDERIVYYKLLRKRTVTILSPYFLFRNTYNNYSSVRWIHAERMCARMNKHAHWISITDEEECNYFTTFEAKLHGDSLS